MMCEICAHSMSNHDMEASEDEHYCNLCFCPGFVPSK